MVKLRVIEGGLLPKEKSERRFITAYCTNTRLMGVFVLHIHWEVLDCPEATDLHQLFYMDCEEYGLDTYESVWSGDTTEVEAKLGAMMGGLGGVEKPVSEAQALELLARYVDFNKAHHLDLPGNTIEYLPMLKGHTPLDENELYELMDIICNPLDAPYGLINHFIMRCFGRDFLAAKYLTDGTVETDLFPELPAASLLKNTVTKIDGKLNAYRCESLLQVPQGHRIEVEEVVIRGMQVVGYTRGSGFPITPQEAAMQLSRPEFITVYELLDSPKGIENDQLELDFHAMADRYETGQLYMVFHENNDHVNQPVFRLGGDVKGMYYLSDHGQFLAAAYDRRAITQMEMRLMTTTLGSYMFPIAKFEFKDPVLLDFIQTDFVDFIEYVEFIKDE